VSKVSDIRRANIRQLIAERGGLTSLSNSMGYKNPSFLSQMTGPRPSREITEKTARRIEEKLSLAPGTLDRQKSAYAPIQATPAASPEHEAAVAMVADVIRFVGKVCADEGLNLGPAKFAEIVAIAFGDAAERGEPRREHVTQLVRLLK
jgi:hypothetical protein